MYTPPEQKLTPDEVSDKAAYEYEQGKKSRYTAILDEMLDDKEVTFESFINLEGADASLHALLTACGQGKERDIIVFAKSLYNRVYADLSDSAELRAR